MNIYELEKQCFLKPMSWETILDSDLRLMEKHCRNNFMKALKEIHRLRDMLVEQRKDGGWPIDDLDYDNRLITELEEVK